MTLRRRTGVRMTQSKDHHHRLRPSRVQVLEKGFWEDAESSGEHSQEPQRWQEVEKFRKGSRWNDLNWEGLRKQASKAHLKRATRK